MKVSCIIPAYNEGPRILDVVKSVCQSSFLDEIIVIDDYSTDNTKKILEQINGIKIISHEKNKGKTAAIISGMNMAKNEYILLIDADLVGLSISAIDDLIMPVIKKDVDITMSIRKNSLSIYKILGIDFVSGERCFKKKILMDEINNLENLPGYGLEVYMNKIIIEKKLKLKIVNWKDVICTTKVDKLGFWRGWIGEIKMLIQIFKTISFIGCIYQIFSLKKLSKR